MGIENQPEVRCSRGHIIPANKTVVLHKDGRETVETEMDRDGKARRMSLIACEKCAIDASVGLPPMSPRKSMARPDALEKLGQEKITGPMIAIN